MCNVMKLNSGVYDSESNPGPNPWRQVVREIERERKAEAER